MTAAGVDRSNTRFALAVLAACMAMNLLSRGAGESFAVFLLPLAREFEADRAALTGIFSVYMLTNGLAAPAIGALFDRIGPRAVYITGMLCFAASYGLAALSDSLWQCYLLLGVLAGVGTAALGIVPSSALVSRWFRQRLSRAMAVLYAAMGTGVLVLAPLCQWLIENQGWRQAYRILGALFLLGLVVTLLAPWRRIARGREPERRDRAVPLADEPVWTLRRAIFSPAFWALFGVMFATAITTFSVTVQAVAYLVECGFAPLEAASVYGLIGFLSVGGMLGVGLLAERWGERRVAVASYSCTILGILALALLRWQPDYLILIAFVLLFGTMQGSRSPLVATLIARLFAGAGVGGIYGGVMLGMGLGAATGSWLAGWLHDLTGRYEAGFAVALLGGTSGIVLFRRLDALAARMAGPRT